MAKRQTSAREATKKRRASTPRISGVVTRQNTTRLKRELAERWSGRMQYRAQTFVTYDIVAKQDCRSSEVKTLPGQFTEFKMTFLRKAALGIAGARP